MYNFQYSYDKTNAVNVTQFAQTHCIYSVVITTTVIAGV